MSAPTAERPLTGLSRTAGGRDVPLARDRAVAHPPEEDRLLSWSAAIAVALLALLLRLRDLGTPDEFAFDETYYAKDGWSLVNHGYVLEYVDDANRRILTGDTTGLWRDEPSMIVHPEVGKWLIGLGELLLGLGPAAWRVPSLVVGCLMVLVMVRLVRRLTGSTLWGCVAGLLLTFDGLHFVLSRLALLDIFVAFFTLCAVHCVVADRDWFRRRLAGLVPDGIGSGWGPVRGLLWRPWLLTGGVCFGLAVGSKWVALYVLAGFGVLSWLWSAGARRSFGVRWPVLRSAVVDGVPAFVHLVLVGFVVYVATWTGWLVNAEEYERALSDTQYTQHDGGEPWPTRDEPDASGVGEVVQSLRSLAYYHRDVYVFHTHFLDDSDHSYESLPLGWLLVNKGVGVNAETDIQPGKQGCDAPEGSDCLRQVLLIGTPALWWGSCLALLASAALWVGRRDWRFGVPVVGTAITWLPWLANDDRPIFFFYAVMTLPFLVIASTLVMAQLVGTARSPGPRRTAGVVVAGSFFLLVLVNFVWFWPIWTNELLTHADWLDRIWFSRWI
ncbi:dolichyl-phosphate-mannose--protein mannosyltransferase [Nocardioides coralli]|uniref:dolichyl-phosphate-mannose--protein mannosyltransferase n=1 Tax=Nocardioides coralli TaxID=2872154 RepID=UPI001CA392E5|nr:phospholipid carrier-dependent glycosyltransferase [Nocardioides coralli]QZY29609.1 phospholipid carrier-dependent glycosyltransferase [Nocardioides coralli]